MRQNKKVQNKLRVSRACLFCFTAGRVLVVHRNRRAPVLSYSILLTCPKCEGKGFI